MIKELSKQIKFFLSQKVYMCILILATALGYGYAVTHSSLGVDDACIEVYFGEGLGLAIGRWPYYLLNKVLHVAEYTPWVTDFLAVLFMMLAAVLWCCLLHIVIKREVQIICYAVFAAMFVDYSLIAEVFTFSLQNGVPIIYCLIALVLLFLYLFLTNSKGRMERIVAILIMGTILSVAIGFYESAAGVFLTGVLIVIGADILAENALGADKVRRIVEICLFSGLLLCIVIVERSIINSVLMQVFHVEPYGYRSALDFFEIIQNPGRILTIGLEILRDYVFVASRYYPIKIFLVATVICVAASIYATFKKRKITPLLVGVLLYASLFLLSLFQGGSMPYRSAQGISVFVSVMLFMLCVWASEKHCIVKLFSWGVSGILIFNSAVDLNQWFVFEYEKNQKELQVVDSIMLDLEQIGYEPYTKPLVFIGEYQFDDWIIDSHSIQNGHVGYWNVRKINDYLGIEPYYRYSFVDTLDNSVLSWGISGLHEYAGYNSMMYWLFRHCGYEISVGTDEDYLWAQELLYEMPDYPVEGYIREYADCIVIKL